jgi:hypothetical protein
MRRAFLAVLALSLCAAPAPAALNRSIMVPIYAPCPGSGNCFPPVLASSYTFEKVYLYSSSQPYTGPGKLALMVVVKGLRDASGALATVRLTLRLPPSRITILSQPGVGTLGETSPLSPETVYTVDVQNGAARARFRTPEATPQRGLVVNTFASPVLYDPDGNPLASTGAQAKPLE